MRRTIFSWLVHPIAFDQGRLILLLLWYAAALVFLLSVPARLIFGNGVLALSAGLQVQVWVWGLAFLAHVLSLFLAARRNEITLWRILLHGVVVFAVAGTTLILFDQQVSVVGWATAVALAFVFAAMPAILGRALIVGTATLVATIAFSGLAFKSPKRVFAIQPSIATALHTITVHDYANLIPNVVSEAKGGGLALAGDGFVLVTGDGRLYRLDWRSPGGELRAAKLSLTADINREAFIVDAPTVIAAHAGEVPLRTLDMVLDTIASPTRVYLAHQYWNSSDRCLTIRVSVADLPVDATTVEGANAWRVVYETKPCVPPSYELRRAKPGARLAWLGRDTLLLSIGDHALSGEDGKEGPQDPNSPYGKILRLQLSGKNDVYSLGHRNPQGLVVTPDGRVWSTEHGPEGGDEINHIAFRANYGWPLATYGVQYGQAHWPLAATHRDHGEFREPALAFVPSIGISNLISLDTAGFPAWAGDLLVASLRERTLFRLRTRDDRVILAERIPIDVQIRDLEQGRDGRILLWTDDSRIVVLARADDGTRAQRAYAACAACHGAQLEGTPRGPSLNGIVGREVAGDPDFDYSPALRQLGGRWTTERLDAFLRNPSGFAKGTSMSFPGVDRLTSLDLIGYLRTRQPAPRRNP